jgi:hypothetical protein
MEVLFEMYKEDSGGAEKEQTEENKATEATKKKSDKDKVPKRAHEDYRL